MRRIPMMALACAMAVATVPASAVQCYSMFDARNNRVFQTETAPIDLSRPISGEMAKRFPGRYLIISDNGSCAESATGAPAGLLAGGDFAGTSPAAAATPPLDAAPVRRRARATARAR